MPEDDGNKTGGDDIKRIEAEVRLEVTEKPFFVCLIARLSTGMLAGEVLHEDDTAELCADWVKHNRHNVMIPSHPDLIAARFYILEAFGEEGRKLIDPSQQ